METAAQTFQTHPARYVESNNFFEAGNSNNIPITQHGQWECNAATLEVCTYFTLLGEHPDKIIPTIACLENHLMYPGENMEHLHQITEEVKCMK